MTDKLEQEWKADDRVFETMRIREEAFFAYSDALDNSNDPMVEARLGQRLEDADEAHWEACRRYYGIVEQNS